jgi:hypothetical protein
MQLVFREHPTSNLEIYIAPECPHKDYEFADTMLKHFTLVCGITSYRELDQFKKFVHLHGHELVIIPKGT